MDNITDDEDFLELVNIVQQYDVRRRRVFRPRPNHFEKWTENQFFDRFRVSKNTARDILRRINLKQITQRNKALTPAEMLLLTLRFYATGNMLVAVADFAGVHKSTASRVINKVSRAIASLSRQFIKMPVLEEDLDKVRLEFYQIARFPRCIGALDCTHIKIQSPGGVNSELYRNQKGYFSLNVQCICDATLNIRNIVCRWPGSSHDANIFNASRIRNRFENGEFGNHVLVGDSGYEIRPFLITPLQNPVGVAEQLFNESQIKTRSPIEKCFGIWKRRFPVLALGIRLGLDKLEAVVVATAVLHNIAQQNGDPEPPIVDEDLATFIDEMSNFNNELPEGNNNRTRQCLIEKYFAKL